MSILEEILEMKWETVIGKMFFYWLQDVLVDNTTMYLWLEGTCWGRYINIGRYRYFYFFVVLPAAGNEVIGYSPGNQHNHPKKYGL